MENWWNENSHLQKLPRIEDLKNRLEQLSLTEKKKGEKL